MSKLVPTHHTTLTFPDIAELTFVRADAAPDPLAPLDALIEVPHGATRAEDFTRLAARLTSPLPEDLIAFFFVNTDIGAPELGLSLADHLAATAPGQTIAVVRSAIPRTFIDCNRRIDGVGGGGMTPGLMPWITEAADRDLLVDLHRRYLDAVSELTARLSPHGPMVLMHTYAPRSVGVEVDLDIVKSLRAAYAPDVLPRWPERPPLDVISRWPDGTRAVPDALWEALTAQLAPLGIAPGDSATYRLHEATVGHAWAERFAGRVLCPEIRRDLLVENLQPFAANMIDPARVNPLAEAIGAALRQVFPA